MKKRGYKAIPKKETKTAVLKKPADMGSPRSETTRTETPSDRTQTGFQEGQCVGLVIGGRTEIGYRAVVDNSCEGLLYKNEVYQPLRKGQRIAGYIKKVREDGKLDLCLQKPGTEKVDELSRTIMGMLEEQGGFIALEDKSPPEEIYRLFGVSKRTFKKSVGALYKKRLIVIQSGGIRLAKEGSQS